MGRCGGLRRLEELCGLCGVGGEHAAKRVKDTGGEDFLALFAGAGAAFFFPPKSMTGPMRPVRVDMVLNAAADASTSAKNTANLNI